MSRRTIFQLIFVGIVIQVPIWCQTRSRELYFDQLTASAKVLLAANSTASHSGPKNESTTELQWPELKDLDPATKSPSAKVKSFNNKKVSISGFMVPLEDKQNRVTEFLLVPSPMSCIHVPPPPPQQIIYVIVAKEKNVALSLGAIEVTGTFYATGNKTSNASSLYTMEADTVVNTK